VFGTFLGKLEVTIFQKKIYIELYGNALPTFSNGNKSMEIKEITLFPKTFISQIFFSTL